MCNFFVKASTGDFQFWEEQRLIGRWRWIVKYGIMAFGTMFFLIKCLWSVIFNNSSVFTSSMLVYNIIPSFLTGFVWGIFIWNANEKRYKRFLEEQKIFIEQNPND